MSRYPNKRAAVALARIPGTSVESETDNLTARCKFNFSYFEVQDAGQDFGDWTNGQLVKLLNKLKEFSKEPLTYWMDQGPYVEYGNFPSSTEFHHPRHVPHEARWGRFRIEAKVRLAGFVLPGDFSGRIHARTKMPFDVNTFYVVFLDQDHLFYKLEDR